MGNAYLVQPGGGGGKPIKRAVITLSETEYTYDGDQHSPTVESVILGKNELVLNRDYVVYAPPVIDAGDYTVIVSGMGEYAGVAQAQWRINKAQGSISLEPESIEITGPIGSTTTATLHVVGDGEITFGESELVSAQREGDTVTFTSLSEGSGQITITLEDGQNYIGESINVDVKIVLGSKILEENSWDTIAAIAASGKASEFWSVGDKKAVTINGKTYHMQIIDFDHDDLDPTDAHYSDASYNKGTKKAAMTLMMEEILSDTKRMNSSNNNGLSWEKCEFRITTLSTIKSQIDPLLVAVARKVTKLTAQSGSSATILKTADDFFMASEIEVFGNNDNSKPGEGTVYNYFRAGNSRVKKKDGYAYYWWLRSPFSGSDYYFLNVNSNSSWSVNYASDSAGVVLCVCI